MRIWDIDPGYLNRQSLLDEHLQLHDLVSIIVNEKQGDSHHPETLRWIHFGWALQQRHRQISAEMKLRGYQDQLPISLQSAKGTWPSAYLDSPSRQFEILLSKYQTSESGRITIPKNAQEIWRQHKYSVMARSNNYYREIGKQVATYSPKDDFSDIAKTLSELLRVTPSKGGIRNAAQHMWGYVADLEATPAKTIEQWSLTEMLTEIQHRAMKYNVAYITSSTALAELMVWID